MEVRYEKNIITPENVHLFAYTNIDEVKGEIKGIVVDFHGLNFNTYKTEASDLEKEMGSKGILSIMPYYGPWSWMNDQAIKYVDLVVETVCKRDNVDIGKVKVVYLGGSMGGLSAMVYTRYARVTPNACFVFCPVCDLKYHAHERPDLPRTVYIAFSNGECDIEENIERHSPFHLAEEMPDIPYVIMHGTADQSVNKQIHSDRLVEKLRSLGRNVEYIEVEGAGHCTFRGYPERDVFYSKLMDTIV